MSDVSHLCVSKWQQMVVFHGLLFRCAYDLKYEHYSGADPGFDQGGGPRSLQAYIADGA